MKRYLASVSLAARSAGSEVALVDVLALEAPASDSPVSRTRAESIPLDTAHLAFSYPLPGV